jgi:subtilisin family serine protease
VLVALAVAVYAVLLLRRAVRSGTKTTAPSVATLIPPRGNGIAVLEASVLVGSLAASLVDEMGSKEAGSSDSYSDSEAANTPTLEPLPPYEADKVLEEVRDTIPPAARRWARVHYWLALVGALAWTVAQVAGGLLSKEQDWRGAVFPVSLAPRCLAKMTN